MSVFALPDGITWRLQMLRRYWYLVSTFRNGVTLARNYRQRVASHRAVCWDGTVIRHPAQRAGLTETILELWLDQAYTRQFYNPRGGDVVIDAGANIGLFSIWLARQRPDCRIIAFEPFAENYTLLEENLRAARASCVETHLAAISGKSGFASLKASDRSLDHQLIPAASTDRSEGGVRVYSFADVLELAKAQKVAFAKIDIEGCEYELFSDISPSDLKRVSRFAIEYHEHIRPGVLELLRDRLSATHTLTVHSEKPGVYGLVLAAEKDT